MMYKNSKSAGSYHWKTTRHSKKTIAHNKQGISSKLKKFKKAFIVYRKTIRIFFIYFQSKVKQRWRNAIKQLKVNGFAT